MAKYTISDQASFNISFRSAIADFVVFGKVSIQLLSLAILLLKGLLMHLSLSAQKSFSLLRLDILSMNSLSWGPLLAKTLPSVMKPQKSRSSKKIKST